MWTRPAGHRADPAVDVAELLTRELGRSLVIPPGDERLEAYGRDESPLGLYPADCAALCETAEQVAWVLRIAREHHIPVTPRGAGSGMTGGALPLRGGIVLSTERMRKVVEIDTDDLVCVVEPGVITGELQAQVEEAGLFYPPDPASLGFCSIGGNVVSNAGGPRAFKYGVTREYVLGVDVALMGGERLRAGRRTVKGVTGYDIVAGFVGSEGTFGVVTEVVLKLLPLPARVETAMAVFADMHAAAQVVATLLKRGFRPRTLEIADRSAIDHIRAKAAYRFPASCGAVLWIEVDGEPEGLQSTLLRCGELCEQGGAIDVLVAQGSAERRSMWDARRAISPSLRDAHRHKVSEDICVPRGSIPEMVARAQTVAAQHDLSVAIFGHAGDGNLHVNFLIDEDPADSAVASRLQAAIMALFQHTIALRGTLSGEHGIGLCKKAYMSLEQSQSLLEWQRRWKAMWDPDDLLNPGKILPSRTKRCDE